MINDIENCAFCSGYPCRELLEVHNIQKLSNRKEFVEATGKEISPKDYKHFIEPYAGLSHLNKIRQTLSDGDYKDFKKFSPKKRFASLEDIDDRQETLRRIYQLLTTLCVEKDISYARLLTNERKRKQMMRILWTAGRLGVPNKGKGFVEVDSKTFMTQKIHGTYAVLSRYLNNLKNYDIHCEIIPLIEKGWLTPGGGLRKEGWIFRMKFGDLLKGSDALEVFKRYTQKLDSQYGSRAFKLFNKADLSVMVE